MLLLPTRTYQKEGILMTLAQKIKHAIRVSPDIGHITDPALNALTSIMVNAVRPHQNKLLTPATLLEIQQSIAEGIVKQAKKFTSPDDFGAPVETFRQTADEMKKKRPLNERDMKDPSKHAIKDVTLGLYSQGGLTCGTAIEIDPYLFMPNP